LRLEHVRRRIEDFDILHFHTDHTHFPMVRDSAAPAVTTEPAPVFVLAEEPYACRD
jgi:hypothetical protein